MLNQTADRGRCGEEAAEQWLRRNGFEICARNWRNGHYEIDLIARKWDALHFVEVKTRRADGLTTPEEAITPQKFRSLSHAATTYLTQHPTNLEPQFDLAAIDVHPDGTFTVRFIENAMEYNW
ncbi:MAG: YraN family protein [Alistipes sp.]